MFWRGPDALSYLLFLRQLQPSKKPSYRTVPYYRTALSLEIGKFHTVNQTSPAITYRAADADFGRTVEITEYDRPGDGDDAVTGQSIAIMQALTARDATHPRVKQAARQAVQEARLNPDASLSDIATLAIFPWVKKSIRYLPESQLATPFHTDDFERIDQQLIPPAALLAMPEPEGDCPQFAMLTAAMCAHWHIPTAFKSIAADADQPHVFSHVYCVCQPEPGRFVPLDTSNAPGPDLEYAKPTKSKLWPNHQDTSKEAMIRNEAVNRSRLALLGDAESDIAAYQPGGDMYTPPDWTDTYQPGSPIVIQGPTQPSPSQLPELFATIANDAARIAGPLIATQTRQQPYYIQGSGGAQVLYDPNTGQVATAATTRTTDLAAGVRAVTSAIPSAWLIGAVVLVGALAFASNKR